MPNKSPLATAGCLLAAFLMSVPATSLAGGNGQEKKMSLIKRIVRGFSAIDTNYIEPQHYNFTAMVQTTFNYDIYRLKGNSGQTVTLSPDIAMKLGPYFGWKWFFLGYTFDLRHFGFSDGGRKREVSFSIYSSQIGIDLFYRRTGSDYKIRDAHLGDGIDASRLDNVPFDGINVGITGASVYYVFNHERFSYPAAFAQSSLIPPRLRRTSCKGSLPVGRRSTSTAPAAASTSPGPGRAVLWRGRRRRAVRRFHASFFSTMCSASSRVYESRAFFLGERLFCSNVPAETSPR